MQASDVLTPDTEASCEALTPRGTLHGKLQSFYRWCLSKKWPLAIGFALLFVVLLFSIRGLQSSFFKISILWEDDANFYSVFIRDDFWHFVFVTGRPVSRFLMGIGFKLFDTDVPSLMWYWAVYFAATLCCLYALLVYVSSKPILSLLFLFAALVSRLNWYYYGYAHGVMESSALCFTILACLCLIKWQKGGRWPYLLAALILGALSMLAHERFMGVVLAVGVVGVIFMRRWWKRLIVGGGALTAVGYFYIQKSVIAGEKFWVVTGHQDISHSPWQLIANFWRIFVNCFALDETNHWYTGMSNDMLDAFGTASMVICVILAVFGFGFILYDLIRSFMKKDWPHLALYLTLALFYVALAAGGSVSTERIETRWIYPPQAFLFCLWALGIGSFRLPRLKAMKPKTNAIVSLSSSLGVGLLLVAALANASLYVVNNKYQYFIDEWHAEGARWDEAIVQPFLKSGKSKLVVCSEAKNERLLGFLFDQKHIADRASMYLEGVKGSRPAYEEWDDTYIVRWDGGATSPVLLDYDYRLAGQWIEKNYNFYVKAESHYVPFSIFKTENPLGKDNGLTVKVNGKTVYHELIDRDKDLSIPLEYHQLNYVELIPDFTWNPKAMGLSDDERDLGLLMSHIGPTDIDDFPAIDFWSTPSLQYGIYAEEAATLEFQFAPVDWPLETSNGVSIYQNKELLFHDKIDKVAISYRFPIVTGEIALIEVIPDYSYNPKKMGIGEDGRDLGVLVASAAIVEEGLSPLKGEWTVPNFKTAFFNAEYSALSVTYASIDWPTGTPNGATIKINGEAVRHDSLDIHEPLTVTVDLHQNRTNYVEIVPDYSFNPKKMGIGEDDRDLGVLLDDLHGVPHAEA